MSIPINTGIHTKELITVILDPNKVLILDEWNNIDADRESGLRKKVGAENAYLYKLYSYENTVR